MGFRFNIEKAMQSVATLLHFHGTKEMSYLRLLKILYIADRESLQETGQPITGDQIVAMEHGPVLSAVYDLIKGEHSSWSTWSKFFKKIGYRIEMIADPGNGKLSKYEIGKLRNLTTKYEDRNEWDMVDAVHKFEEWKKNNPGKSSRLIPIDDLLAAVGRADDKESIMQDAFDQEAYDRFFAEEANVAIGILKRIREGAANSERMCLDHADIVIEQKLIDC